MRQVQNPVTTPLLPPPGKRQVWGRKGGLLPVGNGVAVAGYETMARYPFRPVFENGC